MPSRSYIQVFVIVLFGFFGGLAWLLKAMLPQWMQQKKLW